MPARLARTCRGATVVALLCLVACGLGCGTPLPKDKPSATELHHHNWWNYYRRGEARLDEGSFEQARMDFERCLGLRPGVTYEFAQDVWRARTYGLHFLEGYFPHRELGICLYHLGDTTNAVAYLERSLAQEPSGRAKHYLNLARKQLLTGKRLRPPDIEVERNVARPWKRDRVLEVTGLVRGEGYISEVDVDGRKQFIELASKEMGFRDTIHLSEGTNWIVIAAGDLMGQRATRRVVWIADWQPPELLIKKATQQARGWVLEGVCIDDVALADVSAGSALQKSYSTVLGRETRSVPVTLRIKHGEPLSFTAQDAAGNRLEAILTEDIFSRMGETIAVSLAMEGVDGVLDTGGSVIQLAAGRGDASQDRLRPSLRIASPSATHVFDDEVYMDGSASDRGGLASIRINGEELLPSGHEGAIHYRFARRLPLELGTNMFEVVAEDRAGNRRTDRFKVVRKTPVYLGAEYRLTMGLPPLSRPGVGEHASSAHSGEIRAQVEQELLRQPVRFRLLERDEGWDFILQEQELSLSDLADPGAALKIGSMLPAELLLMASVIPHEAGVTIYAKVVETEQGTVVCAEDVYSEKIEDDLEYKAAGLVSKIEQDFPLVEGRILARSRAKATLGVGADDGVRDGTKLIVIEAEGDDSPDAGGVLTFGDKAVELVVYRTDGTRSVARIVPARARRAVAPGASVYAK